MKYDYREFKTVAVIASNVEPKIALNIVGHLGTALGASVGREIMGRTTHVDASGVEHFGISKYPFIITKVKQGKLRKAIQAARQDPALKVFDFPKQMVDTGHDDELSASIAETDEDKFEYLGAVFFGRSSRLDPITGRFSLWS